MMNNFFFGFANVKNVVILNFRLIKGDMISTKFQPVRMKYIGHKA